MTATPLVEPATPRRVFLRPLDLLLVAVITAATYMPNLYGVFSPLDDYLMLKEPQQFKYPTWPGYWQFWLSPPYRIFMPLTETIWQLIARFSFHPETSSSSATMSVIGFKIASIVVHMLAAVAAAWALSIITKSRWPAIVGGLLWALHPVQVESVAWTTGLKDELCGLFALLTIGFYFDYAQNDPSTPWRNWRWYVAFAAAVLAMLSKPTGMMLAASVVVIDLIVRDAPLVRRLPSLWVFFVPAAACANIARAVQAASNVPTVPVWARPLVVTDTFAFYFYKILWPFNLAQDYGRHPQFIWQNGQIWWTWIFSLGALLALLMLRSRLVVLAILLFAIPLLPVSGISPFDMQQYSTPADHYLYQSMFGVALLATLLLRRPRNWLDVTAVFVVGLLAVLSWRQTQLWRHPHTLFEQMLKNNPDSRMAKAIMSGAASEVGDTAYAAKLANELLAIPYQAGSGAKLLVPVRIRQERYREAADMARMAMKNGIDSTGVARRLMEIGAKLHDQNMALEGVHEWLRLEPNNRVALNIQAQIEKAVRRQQKSSAASAPTSTLPATSAPTHE